MATVVIIGAGIAGVTAARHLLRSGHSVRVIDKGRSVGGRMATRRIGGLAYDHGAQFFTARSSRFSAWVEAWIADGSASLWCHGFPQAPGAEHRDGHPRYRGTTGMNAVVKAWATGLDVTVGARVLAVDWTDGTWHVGAQGGRCWQAEALLLTPPAPQTVALLAPVAAQVPGAIMDTLRGLEYDACLALMGRWRHVPEVSGCGALQLGGEPVHWVADNGVKGINEQPGTLTIHAGPAFSAAHFDAPQGDIVEALVADLPVAVDGEPDSVCLQRWRYAQPRQPHAERCLWARAPGPVAFAGDTFGESRVEGAALSGAAAAEALDALLS